MERPNLLLTTKSATEAWDGEHVHVPAFSIDAWFFLVFVSGSATVDCSNLWNYGGVRPGLNGG